ncbi:MAG: succinylglutamate desuccinylase/aspartoacylase family protein [Pirellulales bacterium]|nr:succinylglutamate desuccinylase/aspartoacylase family protein [Pirellulales bacterium]
MARKKPGAPHRRPRDDHRVRFHYSFLKILGGSDLSRRRLPYMEARSPQAGPAVWLTACSHGEEVGGIVVVQEVFKRLRRATLLKGSLHAFPLMNPLGFEAGARHVTLSEEDLNRSFPGSPHGTLAERIADRIFCSIEQTEPLIVLDLHNDWIRSIPYTVLDPPPDSLDPAVADRAAALAAETGFVLVMEPSPLRKTLSHSLMLRGVAALTIELGESYVVNEKNVELGVRSVFAVLSNLGMVAAEAEPFRFAVPEDVRGKVLHYSNQPVSSTSGILRFLVSPGTLVRAGQPVAKVFNAFGRFQETLSALGDGIVLGHSDSSVAYPGAPVMAFGVTETQADATCQPNGD